LSKMDLLIPYEGTVRRYIRATVGHIKRRCTFAYPMQPPS